MRVTPDSTLKTLVNNLRDATEAQTGALEDLSSGKRIHKSSDDVAGISLGKKLDAFVRSQRQAQRNANDGISFVQTAEGGLNEISNILVRLRELSIQSASDTVGDKERGMIDKEYQNLVLEVDRIAESTSFNGTNVINGDGKGILQFQVGSFKGEENIIEFDTTGNFTDADNLGINGTNVASKDDSLTNIAVLDEAIDKVSGQRAYLGSIQSRMGHAATNIEVSIETHMEARSKIEDADFAQSAAELASANTLKSSGIRALAEGMKFTQGALKLLG